MNSHPCPSCGKILDRMHIKFDRKKFPDLPPAAWVYVCGDCHFMGHLTGNKEQDLKARNLFDVKACDG